jgi:hypothetical protein
MFCSYVSKLPSWLLVSETACRPLQDLGTIWGYWDDVLELRFAENNNFAMIHMPMSLDMVVHACNCVRHERSEKHSGPEPPYPLPHKSS